MKIDASVRSFQPSTAQQVSDPAADIAANAASNEKGALTTQQDRLSLTDEAVRISREGVKPHHMHRNHEGGFTKLFADFLKEMLNTLTGRDVEHLEPSDDDEGGVNEQPLSTPGPLPAQTSQTASFQQTTLVYREFNLSLSGTLNTADGKQLAFTLDLQYDNARILSQSAEVRLGTDGAAFSFSGTAAELSSTSFSFTLASIDSGQEGIKGHGRFNLNHEISAVLKEAKPLIKEFLSESGSSASFGDLNRALRSTD